MKIAPNFKRRAFIQNFFGVSVLLSTSGLSLLTSCKGSDDDNTYNIDTSPDVDPGTDPGAGLDPGGSCIANGTEIAIQVTHTPNHTLFISKDDVNAGVEKTYTLENNGSGHIHSVTVTAADFATLRTNTSIRLTSTNNASHTHLVDIGCL